MPERQSYRHGRIVWAYLRSNLTGKREMHPAIILDSDDQIVQPERFDPRAGTDNIVHVIGVTTKHKHYRLPSIPLPYSPQGHAVTGLKQECAAVIGWYDRLTIPDDVTGSNGGFGGDVPADVMLAITTAIRQDLLRKLGKQLGTMQRMIDDLLGPLP